MAILEIDVSGACDACRSGLPGEGHFQCVPGPADRLIKEGWTLEGEWYEDGGWVARLSRVEDAGPVDTALDSEIVYARAYAGELGAELAERLVREYAAAYGVPERDTTVRIARDAAEDS